MKPVYSESFQIIKDIKEGGKEKNDDFDMDILEEGAIEKALNIEKKTLDKKTWKNINEEIDEKYFDESKLKFPKYFLTEFRTELNVHQFIPLEVKKNIQQVGIEYGLFSQIVNIKK